MRQTEFKTLYEYETKIVFGTYNKTGGILQLHISKKATCCRIWTYLNEK